MSWSALLIVVLIALVLAAVIIISVENWTSLELAFAKWEWLALLFASALNMAIAIARWGRGEAKTAIFFGIFAILLLARSACELRRAGRR